MRISHQDFDRLSRTILDLHDFRDLKEFWRVAPGIVLKLFPGKDLVERDRLMLNLLQPHFRLACRNAEDSTRRNGSAARPPKDYKLSAHESDVAHWLGQGKTNPEIAIILRASVRTVENRVARIIAKLGAPNRTAAALAISNSIAH